jgi:tRNA uridine 5-carboxymethylaminomethyl modification enzyme
MFNGQIKGVGARYCPSIEDKAYRYPDKNIHHIFVEPEGLKADTVYPSGVSSSLPEEVQDLFLRTISGLEDINVKQYGYAVEYDVIDTTKLNYGLEHTEISGLYFAGQVNGTSGYEEAAGQGLIAGINAVFSLKGLEPFKLSRKESYIGVMIEDLISNTRDEPYRLFTARSENRLHIREDNAIIRMHKYRELLGLSAKIDKYNDNFVRYFNIIQEALNENYISPEDEFLAKIDLIVPRRTKLIDILKFATIDPVKVLSSYLDHMGIFAPIGVVRTVAICSKYDGYIKRSDDANSKVYKNDNKEIDYSLLLNSDNISYECKARIKKIKPETFGQLKLIEGIRPATLAFVANNIL